ncbi:MAG TPA: IS256 family transposase [bacterium]|nr:IS256 family transposase [bacterium]
MTQKDFSKLIEAVKIVEEFGFEGLEEALTLIFNEAMKAERSRALGAERYERTESRKGYANGFKPKTVNSRLGRLELEIPQVRGEIEFYPSALEKGLRSERALKIVMAEMYVQGVTTRKVRKVFEKLCGVEVTSMEVSRAAKLLDEELEKWRNRPLGEIPYVQFDARYENVRMNGSVVSAATLIAVGVRKDGKRTVIGVSTSVSEAEIHWRKFFESLVKRGLHGIKMITSDDCPGLKTAMKAVFTGVPWTRCHVHLQRNSFKYIPKQAMRDEVSRTISGILNAPDLHEAQRQLAKAVDHYEKKAPKLAEWMDTNIPEGFAIFQLHHKLRRKLRSTNLLERLNREIKRRTRVSTLFPNEESILRLVSAILMEQSEEWETGICYINLEDCSD